MELFQELETLLDTLRRDAVPHALCGGLALAVHGFVRATEAIDVLVEESALAGLRAAVEPLSDASKPKSETRRNRTPKRVRANSKAVRTARGVYAASPSDAPRHSFAPNRAYAEAA